MSKRVKFIDNEYRAEIPLTTAIDFANYFIYQGVPVLYKCYGSGENRTIVFKSDAPNVNVMLAWIRRWEEGHEYCPFCGGVPEVYTHKEPYSSPNITTEIEYAHIRCTKCGCMTNGTTFLEDPEGAWKRWDKRKSYRY